MIDIKVKLLKGATMPSYANEGDAGVDLYPLHETIIAPFAEGVVVGTGVAFELPEGYELQVRPKSGNSIKTPLRVVLGTVDAGYRGEVGVIIDNMSDLPIRIKKDKAIAQGVLKRVPKMNLIQANKLTETERGKGGFGSSGRGI